MREKVQKPVVSVGQEFEFAGSTVTVKAISAQVSFNANGDRTVHPIVIFNNGSEYTGEEIEKALGL